MGATVSPAVVGALAIVEKSGDVRQREGVGRPFRCTSERKVSVCIILLNVCVWLASRLVGALARNVLPRLYWYPGMNDDIKTIGW